MTRRLHRIIMLPLACATLLGTTEPGIEDEGGGRIVGGRVAPPASAPWQAEIFSTALYREDEIAADRSLPASDRTKQFLAERDQSDVNHRCGGAYLGNDWVVTAAHCLYRPVSGFRQVLDDRYIAMRQVRLGTQTISSGGEVRAIRFGLVHAGYAGADSPEHDNDIALLKLVRKPVATTGPILISPIALPAPTYAPLTNAPLLVTGWGKTEAQVAGLSGNLALRASASAQTFVPGSAVLKELALAAVPAERCARTIGIAPGKLAHSICALARPDPQDRLQDQCGGDSGGPLTRSWRGAGGVKHQLVGLVSWSRGCAQRNAAGEPYPGVFIATAPYVGWIGAARQWADAQGTALDATMRTFAAPGRQP